MLMRGPVAFMTGSTLDPLLFVIAHTLSLLCKNSKYYFECDKHLDIERRDRKLEPSAHSFGLDHIEEISIRGSVPAAEMKFTS